MEHFLKLHTSTLLHFGGKYCTFLLLHLFGNFSYYLLKKKEQKKEQTTLIPIIRKMPYI